MRRICTAEYRETHKENYKDYQADLMQNRYRDKKGVPRKGAKRRAKGVKAK
jgi:hypothetical protein